MRTRRITSEKHGMWNAMYGHREAMERADKRATIKRNRMLAEMAAKKAQTNEDAQSTHENTN